MNASEQQVILDTIARCAQRSPETIDASDTLVDLDIDSLKFIMLILDIEQALGRPVFNIESVGNLRTVGDLLALAAETQLS